MDTTLRLLAAGAAGMLAAPAIAQGLTVVNDPWPGEQSHSQVLSGLFGGEFSSLGQISGTGGQGTVDVGLGNGSISAMRVGDLGFDQPADLRGLSESMSDQTFGAGSYNARIVGHNSSLEHEFGVVRSDGSFRSLLNSTDGGDQTLHPGLDFKWAIRTSAGDQFTSDTADNGGVDHMVTYVVFDEANRLLGAVLFFEDWAGPNSDYDYNDLAVFLTLAPTPNAALLGLAGLGGLGAISGRRRR